jgi:hypothetical protein
MRVVVHGESTRDLQVVALDLPGKLRKFDLFPLSKVQREIAQQHNNTVGRQAEQLVNGLVSHMTTR